MCLEYLILYPDSNEHIAVKDATLVQKYIVKLEQLDNIQLCNADCDGDGDITVADATKIQKIVVGIN